MIADTGMSEAKYLDTVAEALRLMNDKGGHANGPTHQEIHEKNQQQIHENNQQKNHENNQQGSSQGMGKLHKVVYAARKTVTMQCVVSDPAAVLLAVALANRADEGKRYTLFFAPNGYDDEVSHCHSLSLFTRSTLSPLSIHTVYASLHSLSLPPHCGAPSNLPFPTPYSNIYLPQVFLCLSPERLCVVDHTLLLTEALAGTYPREYIEQGGATGDDKTIMEHGKVSGDVVTHSYPINTTYLHTHTFSVHKGNGFYQHTHTYTLSTHAINTLIPYLYTSHHYTLSAHSHPICTLYV